MLKKVFIHMIRKLKHYSKVRGRYSLSALISKQFVIAEADAKIKHDFVESEKMSIKYRLFQLLDN